MIASYKAAWRVGRKTRRRAVVSQVAAKETAAGEWRKTVYRKQNQAWGPHNAGPDGLTPRQRRRIIHKENAAR